MILKKNKIALIGFAAAALLLAGCGTTSPEKSNSQGGNITPESSKPSGGNESQSQADVSSQQDSPKSSSISSSAAPVSSVKHKVTINGTTTEVAEGSALTKPADPEEQDGKVFYGWKNTLNGGQIWDFEREDLNSVMADVNLEPVFVGEYEEQIFEAELCPDITAIYGGESGMPGATYSGGQQGKGLIGRDYFDEYGCTGVDDDTLAFVHFMYVNGDTLTWELESDKDADNVTIFARFGAEYGVVNPTNDERWAKITDTSFPITVNGEKLSYGEITLHNIPEIGQFLSFQDYFLSASVSLKEGKNIIQMKVDNMDTLNGTIASSAPCVDSIKIFGDCNLTWDAAEYDNLERD